MTKKSTIGTKDVIDLSTPKKDKISYRVCLPKKETKVPKKANINEVQKKVPLTTARKKPLSASKAKLAPKKPTIKREPPELCKPRLAKLVKAHGGVKRFAKAIGVAQSTVSSMLYSPIPITDRVAKLIEAFTEGIISFKVLKRMHVNRFSGTFSGDADA